MKVIIVDDEYLIRMGIRSMIEWEDLGCEIAGEASNGEEALKLIEELEPDIVITDVKMPVLGGLELISGASKNKKKPRFLVLSNFSDFHYVREAMKMGAEDYLLKLELEPEQLRKCMEKVIDKISTEKEVRGKDNKILTAQNMKTIQGSFLKGIMNRIYLDEAYVMEKLEFFDIKLTFSNTIYSMIIKIGELYRFEDVSNEELSTLNFSVINIVEEILSDWYDVHCIEGKTSEFIVFATAKEHCINRITDENLIEQGKILREMLSQYLNITAIISIGIGEPGLEGLYQAYKRAVLNIKNRFFTNESEILLLEESQVGIKELENISIYDYKDQLFEALSFQRPKKMKKIMENIRKKITSTPMSKETVCNVVLELYSMIREYEETYQLNGRSLMVCSKKTYQQLICMTHVSEARNWLDHVENDLKNYINSREKEGYHKLISKVKAYIHEHFDEDISLSEVADVVDLNPSYFSTLLKQYTGLSYSEYVIKERIEHAKELLQETNLKVYEVGHAVGYHNIYYFNRIFKKKTGFTPGEYKKRIPGRKLDGTSRI